MVEASRMMGGGYRGGLKILSDRGRAQPPPPQLRGGADEVGPRWKKDEYWACSGGGGPMPPPYVGNPALWGGGKVRSGGTYASTPFSIL